MEMFDILDRHGKVIGRATREECHSGTFYLHGVVHVLVFDSSGNLILQKRSLNKDIEPGKWDTSVGGHIEAGESQEEALIRETGEELGISGVPFELLYTYIIEGEHEREKVITYRCRWDGAISFFQDEIEEVRSCTMKEIESLLRSGFFTPHFEKEWEQYKHWLKENPGR